MKQRAILTAILILTLTLLKTSAQVVITDTGALRTAINTQITPNGAQQITAAKLNRILNGALNVMPFATVAGKVGYTDTAAMLHRTTLNYVTANDSTSTHDIRVSFGTYLQVFGRRTFAGQWDTVNIYSNKDINFQTYNSGNFNVNAYQANFNTPGGVSTTNAFFSPYYNGFVLQGGYGAVYLVSADPSTSVHTQTLQSKTGTIADLDDVSAVSLPAPNTTNYYLNGYKEFVALNTDSIAEGNANFWWSNIYASNGFGVGLFKSTNGHDFTFYADTTKMATLANRQKAADSLGALIAANTTAIATNTTNISGKIAYTDTTVKVATPNQLHADSLVLAAAIASNTTAIAAKVSSQWTTTGSNIYFNTGNVGIGVTNPTHLLTIGGNNPQGYTSAVMIKGRTALGGFLGLQNTDQTSSSDIHFYDSLGNLKASFGRGGANNPLYANQFFFNSNSGENVRWDINGTNKFTVASTGVTFTKTGLSGLGTYLWNLMDSTHTGAGQITELDSTGYASLDFYNYLKSKMFTYGYANPYASAYPDLIYFNSNTTKPMVWGFGGGEKMRLTVQGNLGINTTLPNFKVDLWQHNINYINPSTISGNIDTTITAQNFQDTTASTAGVLEKNPPGIRFAGTYWDGSASQVARGLLYFNGNGSGSNNSFNFMIKRGSAAWNRVFTINAVGQFESPVKFTSFDSRTAYTLGLEYSNNAASTVSYNQNSPLISQYGTGWKTASTAGSQSMSIGQAVAPETGTTNPVGVYKFFYGTNTATPASANELMRMEWGDRTGIKINSQNLTGFVTKIYGALALDATITPTGTDGNQTINKLSGSINIAAGGTSVVLTNSLITSTSNVFPVIKTHDATAYSAQAVPGSGSCTFYLNAAATSEVVIGWEVHN